MEMAVALVTHFGGNIVDGKVGILQEQAGILHPFFGDDFGDLSACVFFYVFRQVTLAVVELFGDSGQGGRLVIGFDIAQYRQYLVINTVIAVFIELEQFREELEDFAGQQERGRGTGTGIGRQDDLDEPGQVVFVAAGEIEIVQIIVFPQKSAEEIVRTVQVPESAVLHFVHLDADVEDDRIGIDSLERVRAGQVHDADVAAVHVKRFRACAVFDDAVQDADDFVKIVAVVRRVLTHPVADQKNILLVNGIDPLQVLFDRNVAVLPESFEIDRWNEIIHENSVVMLKIYLIQAENLPRTKKRIIMTGNGIVTAYIAVLK